jgi:hypothetical protein
MRSNSKFKAAAAFNALLATMRPGHEGPGCVRMG